MYMDDVLNDFSSLLAKRLEKRVYTTEDAIRYTFFYSLINKSEIDISDIILEYPHPYIKKAEIDTYVYPNNLTQGLVVEFKYDRQMPSGHSSPRPQKAGKLFNDIYRLSKFDTTEGMRLLFIYVTDNEMAKYLKNPRNGLIGFFELPLGSTIIIDDDFITTKSQTFKNGISGTINKSVKCVMKESLPNNHELRIYEVMNF